MEYIVVRTSLLDNLVRNVNLKIEEGYVPIGGLTIMENDYPYMQAMVKHKAVELKYFTNDDFKDPSGTFEKVIQPILDKAKA